MQEFHNLLWAKHPKARFKPIIIGSEICTLIEDAPIDWGVRLAALEFYQLDDSSWFSLAQLTESQFLSIDVEILLFLITGRELSTYISLVLDESNAIEVLDNQRSFALGAKKFITDDLRFTTGKSLTPGQLETVLQQIRLGIFGVYTADVAHAIDYVIRRVPNHNALLASEEQRKQDCMRLYIDKSQHAYRLKPAVNHCFQSKVTSASKEHFGNRNREFNLRINFDGSHTLVLLDEVGRPARYPEPMTIIYGELTDGKIDLAIAELLKKTNAQKMQIAVFNKYIVSLGEEQFSLLGIMADVLIDSNNASHSDVAEVIESVSMFDLRKVISSFTTIPLLRGVGTNNNSVVFIRCGSNIIKSAVPYDGSKWMASIAMNHPKRSENFRVDELADMLSSGAILSIDEAVKGNNISTSEFKRAEYITQLFNHASNYLVYSGLTLNRDNWLKELSPESNGWAARYLLRHLAQGNEHLVLIQRSSNHLECHDLPASISLPNAGGAAQQDLETWFNITEDDHLSVLNQNHLICPDPAPESERLKYLSYDEMREKGWRASVAVLYKEVERYFRQQISAENVEQLLGRHELELILLRMIGSPSVKAQELLTHVLNVIAVYVAKNPNEINFLGVDSKMILSVSGRMKIDSYLKYIDWPALCGDRAG